MKRKIEFTFVCGAIAGALLAFAPRAAESRNPARNVGLAAVPAYNPYPRGIIPPDLDWEIARVQRESRTGRAGSKPIVNGRLSPSQTRFVERFLGRYDASDKGLWSPLVGQVLVTLKADGRLAMTSTMDITGSDCRALIGPARRLRAFPALGADAPVDVQFKLNKGNCPWISGRYVTLHYNRALTGGDVYQVEVILHPGARGQGENETQTWDLNKLQPAVATPSGLSSVARRISVFSPACRPVGGGVGSRQCTPAKLAQ